MTALGLVLISAGEGVLRLSEIIFSRFFKSTDSLGIIVFKNLAVC